jgi:cytoskeleton protein RodZ
MKLGEFLRNERELRGITLEEISADTKVNPRFLEAFEHDDISALPAKAFAKGFLRSYARVIGLDEDLVLTNFEYWHQGMHSGGTATIPITPHETARPQRFIFFVLFLIIMLLTGMIVLFYRGILPFNRF